MDRLVGLPASIAWMGIQVCSSKPQPEVLSVWLWHELCKSTTLTGGNPLAPAHDSCSARLVSLPVRQAIHEEGKVPHARLAYGRTEEAGPAQGKEGIGADLKTNG